MRRATMALLAVAVATFPVACSFLALDEIDTGECNEPGRGDAWCAELGDTGDACLTWQCGERFCEQLPRDDDGDEAPPAMCAAMGAPADCDDSDPQNRPNGVEVCDARDNDCDGERDEGAFAAESQTHARAPSTAASVETVVSIAVASPTAPRLLAFHQAAGSGPHVVGAPTPGDTEVSLGAAASTGIAAAAATSASGDVVIAYRGGGACRRFELARVTVPTSVAGALDANVFFRGTGLAQPWGLCTDPTTPADDMDRVGAASIAQSGSATLLSYLVDEPVERGCGSAASVDVALSPVMLGTDDASSTRPARATTLGATADVGPPSLVAMGDGHFVAAHVAAGGAVVLSAIDASEVTADPLPIAELFREDANGTTRTQVTLAASASSPGASTRLAVAWLEGCGARASVKLRILPLPGLSATLSATNVAVPANEAPRRDLALAHHPTRGEWLLAAVEPTRVTGVRVSTDGAAVQPVEMLATAPMSGEFAAPLALVADERAAAGFRGLVLSRTDRDGFTSFGWTCAPAL